MRLRIVEDPLDDRISPVTRVINSILARFDSAPDPEHRLAATARRLRLSGQTEHIGIEPESGTDHVISVVAVLSPKADQSQVHDVITQRLQALLGPVAPQTVAQARAFYDRVVDAAALQRMTIERPLLDHGNVSMRYDYMSGYIPIFILGIIGLSITYAFGRWEKKGLIRKRGVEEAESS